MTTPTNWPHGQLREPFPEADVQWVIVATRNKNKPDQMDLWAPYLDADAILERLDDVVPGQWSMDLQVVNLNAILCRLTVMGVTRSGVGESGKDAAQPLKAAATDSLKRAALLFGIGRYLHKVRKDWRSPQAGKPRNGPADNAKDKSPPAGPPNKSGNKNKAESKNGPPNEGDQTPPTRSPAPNHTDTLTPGQQAFQGVLKGHDLNLRDALGYLDVWDEGKPPKQAMQTLIAELKLRHDCDADAAWRKAAQNLQAAMVDVEQPLPEPP